MPQLINMSVIKVRNSSPTRASPESTTATESSTLMQEKLPDVLGNGIQAHTQQRIDPRCRLMIPLYGWSCAPQPLII